MQIQDAQTTVGIQEHGYLGQIKNRRIEADWLVSLEKDGRRCFVIRAIRYEDATQQNFRRHVGEAKIGSGKLLDSWQDKQQRALALALEAHQKW